MIKNPFKNIKFFEIISKVSIYFLVFLLPIFFLPWTTNVLDFNKQALLIILVFLSFFAYTLKGLISGKISFNLNRFHILIIILFLIYLVSTIFSLWSHGSFWGWPLITADSLLSLTGLVVFYFLIVNIFTKKEILYLAFLLTFSCFLAILFGILQIFGRFLIPLDFTRVVSFNTIGTLNSLGMLAAVLLPLIVILAASAKKMLRLFFIILIVLIAVLLILINFFAIWWVVITASVLLIILTLGIQKKEFFDNRWMILPMTFLTLAMFFSFFRFQIPGIPPRPIEVFLTQEASVNIAREVLRERPILGSGPGTFIYNFLRYKELDFNQSPLWNIRFEYPTSKIINTLITTGILGFLLNFLLVAFFIVMGIRFLFKKSKKNQVKTAEQPLIKKNNSLSQDAEEIKERFLWILAIGLFVSFIALNIGHFLYTSNLTLDFVYFFLLASFISLISSKKEFILKPSSLAAFSVTFIFILMFISALGVIILGGQRYAAEINYLKGTMAWQQQRIDDSIRYLEKAVALNPNMDLYQREISQVYLQKSSEEIMRTGLEQEEIVQRFEILMGNAVNSAKLATDLNPKNVANWSVRGFIYQNLINLFQDAEDWAMRSYDEAIALEQNNPYFPTQKAIILIRKASLLPAENNEEKEKILSEAKLQLEKAINLKSDYALAHFHTATIYQLQGKIKEAINTLEETKRYAPFDIGLAFQLGLLYYQDKNYQRAQVELERAVGVDANYSNALYFLGLTYDQLGQKKQAIEKFERVADLNPDNAEVRKILENLKAGKNALEGITTEVPPAIPIEESPPEL